MVEPVKEMAAGWDGYCASWANRNDGLVWSKYLILIRQYKKGILEEHPFIDGFL